MCAESSNLRDLPLWIFGPHFTHKTSRARTGFLLSTVALQTERLLLPKYLLSGDHEPDVGLGQGFDIKEMCGLEREVGTTCLPTSRTSECPEIRFCVSGALHGAVPWGHPGQVLREVTSSVSS